MPTTTDLRAYVVTGQGEPRRIIDVARAAAAGGAGVVQVRSKPISARALTELAERVALAVAETNPRTRVLVDDRADVAAALMRRGVPVHGAHVGQDDLPVRDVRALLGEHATIGLTTGTLELVRAVHDVADVVDYIGAGPFRPTPTKDSGRPPLGLAGYPPLVAESPVPVVAIGDVTPADAADLAETGVAGVAVSRGFMHASDPAAVARGILAGFGERRG
nr:thiamine phosphate synthase [Corynebacterium halotolerans]